MGFLKKWLDKRQAKKIAKQLCVEDKKLNIKKAKKLKKKQITIDEVREKIAAEAYRLAQRRGFNPAFDEENWVAAEQRVLEKVKLTKLK
eukprot:COSAG06_NODE_21115_length_769_cov_0.638806_1_plen_89_part_00